MSLRIVFMGTPDFAVPSLQRLLAANKQVAGIVTSPDKPAGRGMKPKASPVKQVALSLGLPILQPSRLDDRDFLEHLARWQPDLGVVVAFRKLPSLVWRLPRYGTINLHASLLPQYRGAAPIQRAIMNGEKVTGLTTFFLDDQLDTGPILLQESIDIRENENFGSLYDRMKILGADLVLQTVEQIEKGNVHARPQPATHPLKVAPRIRKEECRLDFEKPAYELYNYVRALSPHPGAFTFVDGKIFKVLQARKNLNPHEYRPGTLCTDRTTTLCFACKQGFLIAEKVQMEGKKMMTVDAFLRGWHPRDPVQLLSPHLLKDYSIG